MKNRIFIIPVLCFLLVKTSTAAPPVDDGKKIFTTRCAACHNVNRDLTGPALAGVHERRPIEWIISFVRSSQTLVKSGDKTAVALFEKFNKVPMPDHPDLTPDNIKNIVEYIKIEGTAAKTVTAKPPRRMPAYIPLSIRDYGFFISFFAVIVILILVLYFAVYAKSLENKIHNKSLPS